MSGALCCCSRLPIPSSGCADGTASNTSGPRVEPLHRTSSSQPSPGASAACLTNVAAKLSTPKGYSYPPHLVPLAVRDPKRLTGLLSRSSSVEELLALHDEHGRAGL